MGYEVYSCDLGHSEELGKDNRHLQVRCGTGGWVASERSSPLVGMQGNNGPLPCQQANFDNFQRFKSDLLNRWGPDFVFG